MQPSSRTILHIEDNMDNRVLVRRLLQSEGYVVVEAGNANEALAVINSQSFDLILMDINMPDMDGYTLTAQLKTMPAIKNVPIVAITANVLRGDRERSIKAGCDGYIEKPIDIDTFLDKVAGFIH